MLKLLKFDNAIETSAIKMNRIRKKELPKNGFATMEPLSRTWLILAFLPRSWLAFARSCMAMVSLPRSWQDLGKASKELAMDLDKDTMASNTGVGHGWTTGGHRKNFGCHLRFTGGTSVDHW